MKRISLLILAILVLNGCGRNLNHLKKLEKKGKIQRAWEGYQEFVAKHPKDPLAPEALFRAGLLAQRQFNDCFMASTFYDRVIERYPQSDPWARAAAFQKYNCPDYFPLLNGTTWVEGDSETKGKNARIEIECRPAGHGRKSMPSETGILARALYAGQSKFKTTEFAYRKEGDELLESISETDPIKKVILKWPLIKGTSWSTRAELKIFHYTIVDDNASVDVAAGHFDQCLHVRSTVEGATGAAHDYYAPGVGRVLTTISVGDGEKRNTELLSYKLAEWVAPQWENASK